MYSVCRAMYDWQGLFNYEDHLASHSVPAFKNEWYWKRLMSGEAEYVEFHNKNYGCSGVMPEKFPCTGPKFS